MSIHANIWEDWLNSVKDACNDIILCEPSAEDGQDDAKKSHMKLLMKLRVTIATKWFSVHGNYRAASELADAVDKLVKEFGDDITFVPNLVMLPTLGPEQQKPGPDDCASRQAASPGPPSTRTTSSDMLDFDCKFLSFDDGDVWSVYKACLGQQQLSLLV